VYLLHAYQQLAAQLSCTEAELLNSLQHLHLQQSLTLGAMKELPVETLALVLQQVTIQHRLKSCALVSHSWRAAAMAATNRINIHNMSVATCSSISAWLAAHGSNVDVMRLSGGKHELQEPAPAPSLGVVENDQGPEAAETELQDLAAAPSLGDAEDDQGPEAAETAPATVVMSSGNSAPSLMQLPCSRLVALSAARLMLHMHPGACPDGTYSSVLSSSANLTRLCLQDCMTYQLESLYALSALTKLQELSLQNVMVQDKDCVRVKAPVPNRLLPILGHLTSLDINQHMSLSAVKSIQHVTGLRSLALDFSTVHKKGVTAVWANMQSRDWQQLSSLNIAMCHGHTIHGKLQAAGINGLTRLTSLKVLKLKHHVFMGACASLLPQLTGLQHLHVEGRWWFDEHLTLFPAVLSTFSVLTQLTHLSIQKLPYCWFRGNLAAISGLTASSKLRELRIGCNTYSSLASAAIKSMFAPSKVWPSLTTLQLGNSTWDSENQGLPAVLGQCCPNLQNLRMASPNLKVQQLSPLAHLSLLHLGTRSSEGAQELAELTKEPQVDTG